MPGQRLSTQQSDNLLAHISPWLAGALGLAASFLTLLALFALLYFILAASGLFQLLGEWARRSVEGEAAYGMGLWRALGTILLQSTLNILTSLWEARWGFLAFGGFGCLAGLVTRRIVRLDPRLGGVGSFLFFFLSSLYLIVPSALYLISGSEALLDMAGVNLDQAIFSSLIVELSVGLFFALVTGTLAWELWRLSYTFLLGWAVALSPHVQRAWQETIRRTEAPRRVMDDYRSYAAHLRELKRDEQALEQTRWRRPKPGDIAIAKWEPVVSHKPDTAPAIPLAEEEKSLAELLTRPLTWALLPAVVILLLCLLGVRTLHPYQAQTAAHTVKNWAVVVSQEKPRMTASVNIIYRPRTLTILKLTGGGMVTITLTGPEPSQEQVWALEWDLSEHPFHREYSIAHLSPGRYQLAFKFEGEGEAGLGYTYSQGGGPVAQRLGLAAGLMLTTAFVAVGAILTAVILHLYITLQGLERG